MIVDKGTSYGSSRMAYTIGLSEASEADMARATRILDAAVLQIEDKAPALFAGPAPLNTNPFDIGSYE